MRMNVAPKTPIAHTHEGAPAARASLEQQLRRSVSSCLLWERENYEDGVEIAKRIRMLADQLPFSTVANLAIEARSVMNLRHAPLWLVASLALRPGPYKGLAEVLERVIQRADELTEFLVMYWEGHGSRSLGREKPRPMSAQVKKGLAAAFRKFDAYQLAKYDRAGKVRLRDVLRAVHPRPLDEEQAKLWKSLIDGTIPSPDTWEVALSSGADKKATWERLLTENRLGYLALLRNLRNMQAAGVDPALVRGKIIDRRGARRVLPFRYVAAARAAPMYEPWLDTALLDAIVEQTVLPGRTVVLVDVSGSMDRPLSMRSDLTRVDAAAALGAIMPCPHLRLFTFSDGLVEVPPRRGMAGVDAIIGSQNHRGTWLGRAVQAINGTVPHDRLIVITDEQSHDAVPAPVAERAYMINVASARYGVGYGRWTRINGFSEGVIRFIAEVEGLTRRDTATGSENVNAESVDSDDD